MAWTGPYLLDSSAMTYSLVMASVLSSDTAHVSFSRWRAHSATGRLIIAALFFSSTSFQRSWGSISISLVKSLKAIYS